MYGFFRKGFSDFKLSASLSAAACVGAVGGANLGAELSGVWFDRTLAAVMIGVLVITMTGVGQQPADDTGKPRNLLAGHVLMIGAGFWGGFIQIGVGFILMPILNRVMGLDLVRVNMHKVFIALSFSIVALAIFASKVDIQWTLGIALAAGYALGGWLGAKATIEKGAPLIKRVFVAAILAMAVKLLFF